MKIIKSIVMAGMTAILLLSAAGCKTTLQGVQSGEYWDHTQVLEEEDYPSLVLPSDREFRILVLTDIQMESVPRNDKKSLEIISRMAEQTSPDLILTAGDNTAWKLDHKLAPRLVQTFESLGIPWAVTLGNHDAEGDGDRYWIGNLYEKAENSLFRSGPSNIHGVGNSAIRLVDEEGVLQKLLVLMDSNGYRVYPEGTTFDFIYYDQIQWYRWLIEGFNRVPSLAFFHIPLIEFKDAAALYKEGKIPEDQVFGELREDVFSPLVNSGLFEVMKELGSTTHIFNGHDHVNNLSLPYEGIRMTYVQKTGPGSYSDEDMRGGTMITIAPGTHDVKIEHISED